MIPPRRLRATAHGWRTPQKYAGRTPPGAGRPGPPRHPAARQPRPRRARERCGAQVPGPGADREGGGDRPGRHRRPRREPGDADVPEHRPAAGRRDRLRGRRRTWRWSTPSPAAPTTRCPPASHADRRHRSSSRLRRLRRRAVPRPARGVRRDVDDPHRVRARVAPRDREQDRDGALLRHHGRDPGSRPRVDARRHRRGAVPLPVRQQASARERSRTRACRASTSRAFHEAIERARDLRQASSSPSCPRCSIRTWSPRSPTSCCGSTRSSGRVRSGRYKDFLHVSLRTTERDVNAGDVLQQVLGSRWAGGHDMIAGGRIRILRRTRAPRRSRRPAYETGCLLYWARPPGRPARPLV